MTSKLDNALAMLRCVVTNPDTPADRAKAQRALDATFNNYGCQPGDIHDFGNGHKLMLIRDPVRENLAWVALASPMAESFRRSPAGGVVDELAEANRITDSVNDALDALAAAGLVHTDTEEGMR